MTFDKRKALQNALTFTQQGKWDKAIAEYLTILRADPRDVTVYNNLGDLYARVGRTGEAIDQYLKLGELYRADGLSVKAVAVYKKIIKLDPNRTAAYLACADLYEEQGLGGEAKVQLQIVAEHYGRTGDSARLVEIYQRLVQLDPTNYALQTKLADLMLKYGMREAAAAEYERAAQAAQATGRITDSRRLLQKARELQPESPEAAVSLAELQLQEGKYAEAVEALTRATVADASNTQAWRLLGEAYGRLGQGQEAVSALERAMGLGLPQAEVRRPLAMALLQVGRVEEGVALCQQITEESIRRGEPDEAIAFCQSLLALMPHLPPVHTHLVTLLQQLGRNEEARSAIWALAAAYEACGETSSAIQVYRQVLERDPSDAEAQERLEVLEGAPSLGVEPAPSPGVEEAAVLVGEQEAIDLPTVEPEPELVLETSPPAEPVIAWPGDSARTIAEEAGLETPAAFGRDARPGHLFELDESGELVGIRQASEGMAGPVANFLGGTDDSPIEFLGEETSALGLLAEEEATGETAEQLAEAEVYLKYGLVEKARERLLAVLRVAPDTLVARRKLKALALERHQTAEACGEILAIAQVLTARGQRDAALHEIQEGLALAPGHAGLEELLGELQGRGMVPRAEEPAGRAAPGPADQVPVFEVPALPEVPGEVSVGAPQGSGWGLGPEPAGEVVEAEGEPALGWALDVGAPAVGLPPSPAQDVGLDRVPVSSGDEELPAEFRTLLEEPGEQPVPMGAGGRAPLDQAMADDLAEAGFYLAQGMLEEARSVHQRMQARNPDHPLVAQLGARLEPPRVAAAPAPSPQAPAAPVPFEPVRPKMAASPGPAGKGAPPEPSVPGQGKVPAGTREARPVSAADLRTPPDLAPPLEPPVPTFMVVDAGASAGAEGFINLGAELEEELAAEERAAAARQSPQVADLLKEFQKGVREHLDEKDFESHYNLGIAYREMNLYDAAIQEFRLAAGDPARALICANLLGVCYLAKGDADKAIRELRAGLEVRGHPREAYHGLRYDLGVAYETQGDLERALESFEALQAENARFRDVRARVKDLRERLRQQGPAAAPASPVQAAEPPKRARESKKKISFI